MALPREVILEQLRRILTSELFGKAGRSRTLLEFLIQEQLQGRGSELKEYTIGSEALGRGQSFDPRTDTIVRAEASRLRSRLERYYAGEGASDPVLIELPKGGYLPEVRKRTVPLAAQPASPGPPAPRLPTQIVLGAVAMAFLAAVVLWERGGTAEPEERRPLTFEAELQKSGVVGSIVGTDVIVSPDGAQLVFVSQDEAGVSRLNVHRLEHSETVELRGTEGARSPFFAPDGGWVGFWASGKLKKTPVEGGSPVVLCDAPDLLGGSWGENGAIVASFGDNHLYRVPASGGAPTVLATTEEGTRVSWPQVLDGGRIVLFTALEPGEGAQTRTEAISLTDQKTKVIARGGGFGRYLPPGYLTYVRQGTLYATRFELERLEAHGQATPILDGVSYDSNFGYAQLDFARNGTLVYRKSGGAVLQWVDADGRTDPIDPKPTESVWPRISPDGTRLVTAGVDGGVTSLSIYDLKSGQSKRTPTDTRYLAVWGPNSQYLVLGGGKGLSWIRADQPGQPRPLNASDKLQVPASIAPDGSRLAYAERSASTHFDIWTAPIQYSGGVLSAGEPELLLGTPAVETYPTFSPDGRWMAYVSGETGRGEVYVRRLPEGPVVRVSPSGGRSPRWSANGRDLFYRTHDHRMMIASYRVDGRALVVERVRSWSPVRLFDTGVLSNFDVGLDGRIAALLPADQPSNRQLQNHVTIVLNFADEVRRRLSDRNQKD